MFLCAKVESFSGYVAWRIHENAAVVTFHVTFYRRSGSFFFSSSLRTVKEKELKIVFKILTAIRNRKLRGERAVFILLFQWRSHSWLYSRLGVYTLESIGKRLIFFSMTSHFLLYNPMPSRSAGIFSFFQIRFLYTRKISSSAWIPFSVYRHLNPRILFFFYSFHFCQKEMQQL